MMIMAIHVITGIWKPIPKFEEMLGLSHDQIVGKRYREIVPGRYNSMVSIITARLPHWIARDLLFYS